MEAFPTITHFHSLGLYTFCLPGSDDLLLWLSYQVIVRSALQSVLQKRCSAAGDAHTVSVTLIKTFMEHLSAAQPSPSLFYRNTRPDLIVKSFLVQYLTLLCSSSCKETNCQFEFLLFLSRCVPFGFCGCQTL